MPACCAARFTTCQTALAVIPSPQIAPHPIYAPKNVAGGDSGGRRPLVDCVFHPRWNRDRSDMLPFTHQVSDDPVVLTHLEIVSSE
jgi:hypothetical protein